MSRRSVSASPSSSHSRCTVAGVSRTSRRPSTTRAEGVNAAQVSQGLAQLLVHPVGVSVDDEQIRGEGAQDAVQQGATDLAQVLVGDAQALGLVDALRLLDPRQHQPVEAIGEAVLLARGQTGDDQAGDVAAGEPRQCPGQVVGQSEVAARCPNPLASWL